MPAFLHVNIASHQARFSEYKFTGLSRRKEATLGLQKNNYNLIAVGCSPVHFHFAYFTLFDLAFYYDYSVMALMSWFQ